MTTSTTAQTRQKVIELRGVSKSFGGVQALTNVDMHLYPGEVVGLVGDNGAGKSTFVKVIAGVLAPDKGEYFFEGQPVPVRGPGDANALGIHAVYQDLALCNNLDAVSNITIDNVGDVVDAGVWTWQQVCKGAETTDVCKAKLK